MKIKTLIPFVVILALLAGLVIWQKTNQAPPAPLATQIGLATLAPEGLNADDIVRIELFAGSEPEEKVVLEEQADKWQITSAFNATVSWKKRWDLKANPAPRKTLKNNSPPMN